MGKKHKKSSDKDEPKFFDCTKSCKNYEAVKAKRSVGHCNVSVEDEGGSWEVTLIVDAFPDWSVKSSFATYRVIVYKEYANTWGKAIAKATDCLVNCSKVLQRPFDSCRTVCGLIIREA